MATVGAQEVKSPYEVEKGAGSKDSFMDTMIQFMTIPWEIWTAAGLNYIASSVGRPLCRPTH